MNHNNINHATGSVPERVPLPVERSEDDIVENVYKGSFDEPDYQSQDEAGLYLLSRFTDDDAFRTRIIATPTGKTWPKIVRVPDGLKNGYRWEHDGWLLRPRTALGIMIGSLALSVAPTAVQDVHDEAKELHHDVGQLFSEPQYESHTVFDKNVSVGPDKTISVDTSTGNMPGSAVVDAGAVERFAGKVKIEKKRGHDIMSLEITGKSSDDYGTNSSIGSKESPDDDFADERATAYSEAIEAALPGEQVRIRIDQNILTDQEKLRIQNAAQQAGFNGPDNIIDAINAVENGSVQNQVLTELVRTLFTERRGVTLQAKVDVPGVERVEYVPREVETLIPVVPPENPDRDYDPWFIPMIPIPKLRRRFSEFLPKKRWEKVPGKTIYSYGLLHEEEDQRWVQLRPEAMRDDKTLVDNPWAYSRMYEHILRDNRIVDVLRADFAGKEGDMKSIRVMFIDKSPAEETITEFSELLKKFAHMDGGKIAERISAIFVYPSENAGRTHSDPRRIGLGVDKQSPAEVMGTYTPILDLVEMHMPTTWNPESVEAMMKSFYGPSWVLSHEAGGHGTDDNDAALHLKKVRTRGIPNAYISVDSPWAKKMTDVDHMLHDLPANYQKNDILFDITYPVTDRDGRVVTMNARVGSQDPRLSHAITATIVDYKPTEYGSVNELEHYAEAAASVITGIEVPFREAVIDVDKRVADNGEDASFATGYRPDVRSQQVVTQSMDAVEGSFPVEFVDSVEVDIRHINPHNDKLIRQEMIRARKTRFPRPDELLSILARVRPTVKK